MFSLSGTKVETQEDLEALQQLTSKGGTKRKGVVSSGQKSKLAKAEGDACASKIASDKNADLGGELSRDSNMESQLEAQTTKLWGLKDDLRKKVSTAEMREMLEANGQDSTGSELDLREHW